MSVVVLKNTSVVDVDEAMLLGDHHVVVEGSVIRRARQFFDEPPATPALG